jgi:hypothetical protein
VLDGLGWACPFRLASLQRAPGTTVGITVTGPDVQIRWALLSDGDVWRFTPAVGRGDHPVSRKPGPVEELGVFGFGAFLAGKESRRAVAAAYELQEPGRWGTTFTVIQS